MTRVLIAEDDPKSRADLSFFLREEGLAVTALESAEEVLARFDAEPPPDLLLLDVRLPGLSGVELVRRLAQEGRLPTTIVISGEASIGETVEALKLGVYDFIEKPFHRQRLLRSIRNTLGHARLERRVHHLEAELGRAQPLLGRSPAMQRLREQIAQAGPTDSRVLILGESGTGKELVADALHAASPRATQPFIKINCAAIPAPLVEAELFGHARGAFTDANIDRPGLFEEADGGTLFLDEIGDMQIGLQGRLLRVLEDGRVRRVGERREREVDVRVLAASHQDLERAVAAGTFRQDLYYRLAHLPIVVPPLRQRASDIPLLFEHFLERFTARARQRRRKVDPALGKRLSAWHWPGNVRELRSLVERLVVFGHDPLTVDQLPEPYRSGSDGSPGGEGLPAEGVVLPLREFHRRCEKEYLERVLRLTGWNVSEAARRLQIHRSRLHQRLNRLGVRRP